MESLPFPPQPRQQSSTFNDLATAISLVCCPPLGIVLVWVWTKWSTTTKFVASAISGGLFLVGLVVSAIAGSTMPAVGPVSSMPVATAHPGNEAQPGDPPPTSTSGRRTAQVGESFRLGDFTYRVTAFEFVDRVGNQFMNQAAGPGALFLVIKYDITNNGNQTETVLSSDFEVIDAQGRRFLPSSEATTTYAMAGGGNDLILSELQPGITRPSVQLFEIPEPALRAGVDLRIPEKGLLGAGEVFVGLVLVGD